MAETIGIGAASVDGDDIYWLEARPSEAGRSVLVMREASGVVRDVTPPPFNVRSRVHEYGGGSYLAAGGTVIFSNFADQRLYRIQASQDPEPLTPETVPPGALRYADAILDATRDRLILIREDHREPDREARNTLCTVSLTTGGTGEILSEGYDFYSSPRLCHEGRRLAWLAWNHPNMPWDGTRLFTASFDESGGLCDVLCVAGGDSESIFQPEWSPDGILHFVSDRSGWWNLYRLSQDGERHAIPLCPMDAEFGRPQWAFGTTTYAFESSTQILCSIGQRGRSQLARLDTGSGQLDFISLPFPEASAPCTSRSSLVVAVASPSKPGGIGCIDRTSGAFSMLKRTTTLSLDEAYLSVPEPIEFPSGDGSAHAFFYAPYNRDFEAPPGEKPPLIVLSHGGPTGAVSSALNLRTQFFTSRGMAVVDVNYGGSTGYGRSYRKRLEGLWGIVDVRDCENAALHLVEQLQVDRERLAIQGGSAGGFTTLAALTFTDTFRAGASYYGVSDLEALARDTHKFESRYLDGLIGPYPSARERYLERSPIQHCDRLSCPVILLQGLEDKVVPPNQAEMMVAALERKGLPVAYVAFEGEQHGFRQAVNIRRALEAEFYFYGRIFEFEPADDIEPVAISNL